MSDKAYELAVFPGDFNPFHYGHIDVLAKASAYVSRILLFVIDTSLERRDSIPPPVLDRGSRHGLVKRYIDDGYLRDVDAQCELHSAGQPFPEYYVSEEPVLICGSDVFNYNRFSADEPQHGEFGWLIENSRRGIILVERPGHPPEETIAAQVKARGLRLDILKGERQIGAREVRKSIAAGRGTGGAVPASLEPDIVRLYGEALGMIERCSSQH